MINQFADITKKYDESYLDSFLNEELIITEKLDTYRILFEKQNDKLIFFKKDNTPLNLIERTLTNIWEDAVVELTTILGDIQIQEGLRFGVAYTPVERPVRIPYSNIPKYILTDVTLRKNNKIIESFDYDEVTSWAATLNIARPPIIFKGLLNEKQKNILKKYGLKKFHELEQDNFADIINELFEKSYSNENIIEGIILQSKKDLYQVISYEFELLNEAYQKETYPRDYYDIILLNISKFLDDYKMPILEGKTSEDLYLSLICDMFNNFCKKNPQIVEGINPDFLTPPSFGYYGDLNLLLINNKKTLELLEKGGKIYEALFKVMLSSLKKHKKEFGLLTNESVSKFNNYVNVIKNVINEEISIQEDNNINESLINEVRSDNVVINSMNKRSYTDLDNMRIIASIQKVFEPSFLHINKGSEKCVVYITECQPFTTSQKNNVIMLYEKYKCPIIIGSLSSKRRLNGKQFHFSDNLIKSQLELIAMFNKETIPAYFLLEKWDLTEIFEYCRPKYEPITLITDVGKKSEFAIQLYFEDEVMNKRINVENEFNIGELENQTKFQAFRSIEDKDFSTFNMYADKSILGLFDNMVTEYKTWSGELINQFKQNEFI